MAKKALLVEWLDFFENLVHLLATKDYGILSLLCEFCGLKVKTQLATSLQSFLVRAVCLNNHGCSGTSGD